MWTEKDHVNFCVYFAILGIFGGLTLLIIPYFNPYRYITLSVGIAMVMSACIGIRMAICGVITEE